MTSRFTLHLFVAATAALVGFSSAVESPRVENFALIDHTGKFHEFDYYRRTPGVEGVVLFIHGNGCPLVRKRVPVLKELRKEYQSKGVLFGMLNANLQDGREDVAEEAKAFKIDMPILMDTHQLVAGMLGVTRTAEALLIEPESRKIVYRGPIDDVMSYQSEKGGLAKHYLKDAIDALLSGREIAEPRVESPGCLITMDSVDLDQVSYSNDIGPMIKRRCVECHTKGGVGPFALSSYKKVKGWSEMMAEMVLTKQMPPWHADPHIGEFKNFGGITDEEAKLLISWIRAGSPRGEGEDPLEVELPPRPEWKLGAPAQIVTIPRQEIPAEGILGYRYLYIDSPFDRDVWISAAEINPGNKAVLHHAIATIEDQNKPKRKNITGNWITGYAPGTDPIPYPKGTGVLLKKNQRINLELHYTVSGRNEVDETRIGFHLLDAPPAKVFKTGVVLHRKFSIPPHQPEYAQSYSRTIRGDILLYGINPHMHFRGKRMSFSIRKPDGTTEELLSVPNYNFNWQRTYLLREPMKIRAGSKLIVNNAWDNSAQNLSNPDPAKTVKWGSQTFDEMFFATFNYIDAN